MIKENELPSFNQLRTQVAVWGHERGIIPNGTPISQFVKLTEELGELASALARMPKGDDLTHDNPHLLEAKDAIGDMMVVQTMICEQLGISLLGCYAGAWEEIKDRKGFLTPEGIFVKDEDTAKQFDAAEHQLDYERRMENQGYPETVLSDEEYFAQQAELSSAN